ncbi:universal stress protein [Nitrosopumilus sp.]
MANPNKIDLIVIGSYGITGLQKLVLGSVAYGVIQNTKLPIILVK